MTDTAAADIRFGCSYFDEGLFNLDGIVERAVRDFEGVTADTLVGTGFSGAVVIPTLARELGKKFVLIRKDNDDSHHGKGRLLGSIGARWLFVDDFVSSGATKTRVLGKIAEALETRRGWGEDVSHIEHAGDYLYNTTWRLHTPTGDPIHTYADGSRRVPTW
jgi:hypothetical protein